MTKTIVNKTVLALCLAVATGFVSCKKTELSGSAAAVSQANQKTINPDPVTPPPTPAPDFFEGFNAYGTGLTPGHDPTDHPATTLKSIRFINPPSWSQGADIKLYGIGGCMQSPELATDMKCYGAGANYQAIGYNLPDGSKRASWLWYTDGSVSTATTVTYNNNYLQLDEIEINPDNGLVYAIASIGVSKCLFVIDPATGFATLVQYQLSNGSVVSAIFSNAVTNGYKSGSLAFVENVPGDANQGHHIAYATESSVYASQGIVVWNFLLSLYQGNPVVISANTIFPNTTYNAATIPGAQTGNINIVSLHGIIYFARDNSPLYQLNGTNSATQLGTANIAAANDFGPKQ